MKKTDLKQVVADGLDRNRAFLAVKIETEGNPAPEIIINPAENVPDKMVYYNLAYNDDLELIRAKEAGKLIRITDAVMTSNLQDLSWFFW